MLDLLEILKRLFIQHYMHISSKIKSLTTSLLFNRMTTGNTIGCCRFQSLLCYPYHTEKSENFLLKIKSC